jgi:hypothetical protein
MTHECRVAWKAQHIYQPYLGFLRQIGPSSGEEFVLTVFAHGLRHPQAAITLDAYNFVYTYRRTTICRRQAVRVLCIVTVQIVRSSFSLFFSNYKYFI